MKQWKFALSISLGLSLYLSYNQPLSAHILQEDLLLEQLKNTVYHLPNGQEISLRDGRYQKQDSTWMLQEKIAIGKINNDEFNDAAVVLSKFRQGVQIANHLAILIANPYEKLKNTDTLDLDKNIKLKTLRIQSRHLLLEFLAYSNTESHCCSIQKKRLKYGFDFGSQLLVPLSVEAQNKSPNSLQINSSSRQTDENYQIQIKF